MTEDHKKASIAPENLHPALVEKGWKQSRTAPGSHEAVTVNQVTTLSALIAYVAHKSGQSEFHVERAVADRFSVPNVKCLPTVQYDNALRYLVDSLSA